MSSSAAPDTARHLTIRCQFCSTWNRVDATRVADHPKCGKCAKPMRLDRPLPLHDDDFSRTISESEIPVFVDFYADWCGPCKMMAPAVDEMAAKYLGRVLVTKLNTDLAQRTAQLYDIRSIPTSIVFSKGKELSRQMGAVPARQLDAMLAKAAP